METGQDWSASVQTCQDGNIFGCIFLGPFISLNQNSVSTKNILDSNVWTKMKSDIQAKLVQPRFVLVIFIPQ